MKKFIAITIALSIVSLIIGASFFVYADDEETSPMTVQEYYAAQSWLISKYCDGTYTYDEYVTQSDSVTNRFIEENSIGTVPDAVMTGYDYAVNRTRAIGEKIGATVEKYGDAAVSYVKSWISDFFDDYSCLSQVNTSGVDMMGYGAMVEIYHGNYVTRWWAEYITYYSEQSCTLHGIGASVGGYISSIDTNTISYNRDVEGLSFYNISGSGLGAITGVNYYGDVRYEDGTSAETDDTYETVEDYDFTQASEQELADLLNKILEALENNNPDLSSIEGLLQAIYYRLGTLDSDDDNAKLDMINASILSLCSAINSNSDDSTDDSNSDDSTDDSNSEDTASDGYAEVLDILIEMRDYLVSPQQPRQRNSTPKDSKNKIKRRNKAARRSMFIAITESRIEDLVVFFNFVYSKPRPNLRFDKLNLRSTSIRSVLSLYSIFLSVSCCFGLPSFLPESLMPRSLQNLMLLLFL